MGVRKWGVDNHGSNKEWVIMEVRKWGMDNHGCKKVGSG